MVTNDIPERMLRVRGIFEDTLLAAGAQPDNETLFDQLEKVDFQFRSIAYEAASMSRALTDLASGSELKVWLPYMKQTRKHAVQVHIGLGWAIGQRQAAVEPVIEQIEPLYQVRVLDGCGYYDGTFRHRSSIRDRVIPAEITADMMSGYDQGIGRSLWYMSKGDVSKLFSLVGPFADARKPDLWRGIGIAMAYVGGFDESLLSAVFEAASKHQFQLSTGAAFLARSRYDAGTENEDAELACRIWCGCSAAAAYKITHDTEPKASLYRTSYLEWVSNMETKFRLQ